jgi:hypothetical protein
MIQHILGLLCFAVIFAGPLPLCLGSIFLLEDGNINKNEESGFSHRLFILIICWCILETFIGLVLGILHQLNLPGVILVEMIIFITGMAFLMSIKHKNPSFRFRDLLRKPGPFNNPGKLIFNVICFVCLFLLWVSVTCPIKEYDSLAFHLPVMAKWYQTGSFTMLEQFSQISRYPYNWEVLCTLYLMPFREYFSTSFSNVIAWVLFGLSVYLLAIKIGAARIHSLAASSLVMTLPIVLRNVNTMHIDLPFAAFFMAALYLIVHSIHTRSLGYLSLFLAALGMLAGIKTSGLIYGMILVVVFALMALRLKYFEKSPLNFSLEPNSAAIPFGIMGGLSFLLLGGFWYLRNFIQLGNPIGFVKVQVGNILIFPGTMEPSDLYRTTLVEVFDLMRLSHWKIFLKQMGHKLGIPFCAIIFLLLILLLTFLTRKKSVNIRILIGLFALSMVTLVLYWLTPYSGTNFTKGGEMAPWVGQAMRYAFPFIGVLGALSAAGAEGDSD